MHTIWTAPAALRRRPALAEQAGRALATALRQIWDGLLAWQDRAAQRHALSTLDDRMLQDIGVSRVDARREAAKPFWRP